MPRSPEMNKVSAVIASLFMLITVTVSLAQEQQPSTELKEEITTVEIGEHGNTAGTPQTKNENTVKIHSVPGEKCITDTGDLLLSIGNFLAFRSFSGELYEDYNKDFSFNPSVKMSLEVFLYKGLALGGIINFDFKNYSGYYESTWGWFYETNTDDFSFQIGPSLNYYLNFYNKYIPYFGINFLYSQRGIEIKTKEDDDVVLSYKRHYFNYEGSIGFMYVIKTYLGIYINYTYTISMSKLDDEKIRSDATDALLADIKYYHKEHWGYCHTLSIGFKVFFDIL